MATWEPDEIDFEDQYDKVDPIDDEDLYRCIYDYIEQIDTSTGRVTRKA